MDFYKSFYGSINDANFYLNDSVVSYEGKPCIVRGVYEERIRLMLGGQEKDISPNDKGLDINPIKNGYYNYGDEAYLAIRRPSRNFRQGMTGTNYGGREHWGHVRQAMLQHKKYFTAEEALSKILSGNSMSCAISINIRFVHTYRGVEVEYLGTRIGILIDNEVVLDEEFKWLLDLGVLNV